MGVTTTAQGTRYGFTAGGDNYQIQIAGTRELKKKAYRLMHDIYEKIGYGHPHPTRMWYSLYELLPDTVTVLVLREGEAVATMSVVFDSPFGLPDDENYADELDELRASGRKLAQIISLGVRTDVRGVTKVLVKLFNYAYFVARGLYGATDFVNTVIPRHAAFYYHKLLFQKVGETRHQPKTGVDVVMIRLDFADAENEAHLEHGTLPGGPIHHSLYRQFKSVYEAPDIVTSLEKDLRRVTDADLRYFLDRKPTLWDNATPEQKMYFELMMGWHGENDEEVWAA